MQILQGRATGDHHPHGEFWVSRFASTPLLFSYEEFSDLLHVERAQHGIKTLAKICIFCHLFDLPIYLKCLTVTSKIRTIPACYRTGFCPCCRSEGSKNIFM